MKKNLKQAKEALHKNGVVHYSPLSGDIDPKEGYLVRVMANSATARLDELIDFLISATLNQLKEVHYMRVLSHGRNNFGGEWYALVPELQEAVELAMSSEQSNILDVANNDWLTDIPYPQKAGTETQKNSYIKLSAAKYVERRKKMFQVGCY